MNKKYITSIIATMILMSLDGCSTRGTGYNKNTSATDRYGTTNNTTQTQKKSSYQYTHPTMRPYVVRGVTYYPKVVSVGDTFHGTASWYGPDFHGKATSSGETYDMWKMTAAHKTLPMNTIVRVTNTRNGKSAVVRINDRGPFVSTRIIDLSKAAAQKIDMIATGTAPVTLEVLGFEEAGKTTIPTAKQLKNSPQQLSLAGKYALQIGSFSRIDGAIRTQEKYNNTDGYKTIIKDMQTNNRRLFKVWLTGFKSEQEAREYKSHGVFDKAFIVRED